MKPYFSSFLYLSIALLSFGFLLVTPHSSTFWETLLLQSPCETGEPILSVGTGSTLALQPIQIDSTLNIDPFIPFNGDVDGEWAIMGVPTDDEIALNSGAVYLYRWEEGEWKEFQRITASDGTERAQFGSSTAISKDWAIVSSLGTDGTTYLFQFDGDRWVEAQKFTVSSTISPSEFGSQVDICGNVAIIGDHLNDDNGRESGAAHLLTYNGERWTEFQNLVSSDIQDGDRFGWDVALSKNTAIVGAYGTNNVDGGGGAGYIFEYDSDSSVWKEVQKLTIEPPFPRLLGWSVSVSEDKALIGSPQDAELGDFAGAAYIFHKEEGSWGFKQKIVGSQTDRGDFFGYSVSLSIDRILVGAYSGRTNLGTTGTAFLYEYNGDQWEEVQMITPEDESVYRLGFDVSLAGGKALITSQYLGEGLDKSTGFLYQLSLPNLFAECEVQVQNVPTMTANCSQIIQGTTNDPLVYPEQGIYTLTWTFEDSTGNVYEELQHIEVRDTTPPAPDSSDLLRIWENCSVTLTPPTATDNCEGTITATTTNPLTYVDQGEYSVTWKYDDGNGNISTQLQFITIRDTIAPVPDTLDLSLIEAFCSNTLIPPTATDNCEGTITATTTDPLTYVDQGEYSVTWEYDDGNGNISTQLQFVTIRDTIAPVPDVSELPKIQDSCMVTLIPPLATDNCQGSIMGTTSDSLSYSEKGEYTVIWEYDDGNSNITTQSQIVEITDSLGACTVITSHLEEVNESALLSIYPNPVRDNIRVTFFPQNPSSKTLVTIFSLHSQVLFRQLYVGEIDQTIEVGNYPAGVYQLSVQGSSFSHSQSLYIQ